jgi:hypothetical protein
MTEIQTEYQFGPAKVAPIDRYSDVWRTVYKWAESEIDKARIKNDNLKLDMERTIALRSRIKTLRELLELPDANKPKGFENDR